MPPSSSANGGNELSLNPPMSAVDFSLSSPLGQLYGSIVRDEDDASQQSLLGRAISTVTRRGRKLSASASDGGGVGQGKWSHRRLSSNVSAPRPVVERPDEESGDDNDGDDELPETVQEVEDEAEKKNVDTTRAGDERKDMLKMLREMKDRQRKMENQIADLLRVLQHQGRQGNGE